MVTTVITVKGFVIDGPDHVKMKTNLQFVQFIKDYKNMHSEFMAFDIERQHFYCWHLCNK